MTTSTLALSIALLVTVAVLLLLLTSRVPEQPREPWHLRKTERHAVRVTWGCALRARMHWLSREDRERAA